jgi:hypothetical protein
MFLPGKMSAHLTNEAQIQAGSNGCEDGIQVRGRVRPALSPWAPTC